MAVFSLQSNEGKTTESEGYMSNQDEENALGGYEERRTHTDATVNKVLFGTCRRIDTKLGAVQDDHSADDLDMVAFEEVARAYNGMRPDRFAIDKETGRVLGYGNIAHNIGLHFWNEALKFCASKNAKNEGQADLMRKNKQQRALLALMPPMPPPPPERGESAAENNSHKPLSEEGRLAQMVVDLLARHFRDYRFKFIAGNCRPKEPLGCDVDAAREAMRAIANLS